MTDEQLLARIAEQDRDALTELYDRYERLVFSMAVRSVGDRFAAEEVVQDVFTKLWKSGSSYDASQGKVSTWLLTITRRTAIDQLRKVGRRVAAAPMDDEILEVVAETSPGPAAIVEEWATRDIVKAAMDELPDDQRHAIERMYYQGLTQREIAEETGVPLGTVKGRIRLGLARLREKLSAARLGESS